MKLLRTRVYIDGYNLYYSLLRKTPHKWLNLKALFEKILKAQNPACELISIKYYTAPVKASFASHGKDSVIAQNDYHKALAANECMVIKGSHYIKKSTPLKFQKPPNKDERVEVWSIEEKQTDVNIALDMYRDALKSTTDHIVLCSNDIDLETPLKYLKEDFPNTLRGLIIPLPKGEKNRRPSKTLVNLSSWCKRYIAEDELIKSQFKPRVATKKKPANKPKHW